MKNLFIPLMICMTAMLMSCGSSNLSPQEMVEIGVEKYNNAQYYEAAEWFQKAAELGNAQAQNNLGILYKYGTGVDRDIAKAAYWFAKAAEQGYDHAISNLACLNDSTIGVPADLPFVDSDIVEEAYDSIWYSTPDSVIYQMELEAEHLAEHTQATHVEERPAPVKQQNQSGNYRSINYFSTGYITNGEGGWIFQGHSDPAKEFLLSDSKIIADQLSFTNTRQLTLFNIPVQVYRCDTNNNFFILRNGAELIYAMTDYGLFLAELQQVGVPNQLLSRNVISGRYNVGSSTLSSASTTNQNASTPQRTRRTCNLCNGTGKFEKDYGPQYGVPGAVDRMYWCDICQGYDRPHYHKTCPSCGGKGTVE